GVRVGISEKCCWTSPIPSARACRGLRISTGRPSITSRPSSGRTSPYRMPINVVFPAPFSPTSACTSPPFRLRSIRSLATTAGYALLIPSKRRRQSGATLVVRPSLLTRLVMLHVDLPASDLLLDLDGLFVQFIGEKLRVGQDRPPVLRDRVHGRLTHEGAVLDGLDDVGDEPDLRLEDGGDDHLRSLVTVVCPFSDDEHVTSSLGGVE